MLSALTPESLQQMTLLASPLLQTTTGNALTYAVKLLTGLVKRVTAREAARVLNEAGEQLRLCFCDSSADLRKNVVFCIVEFHAKVGAHDFEMFLRSLTKSQEKLARIYIKRKEERALLLS